MELDIALFSGENACNLLLQLKTEQDFENWGGLPVCPSLGCRPALL